MNKEKLNPFGYGTNEYWEWEKKYNKEAFYQEDNPESNYDWDHTETYDDGY